MTESDDRDLRQAEQQQARAKHWYETLPPAVTAHDGSHADLAEHAAGAVAQFQHRLEVTRELAREAQRRMLEAIGIEDQFLRDALFSLAVALLNEASSDGPCHCQTCAPGHKLTPGELTAALHSARASVRSRPRVGPRLQLLPAPGEER